ncbi:DUF4139 domain-containing protein [Luteolibacter flavescens]|uniref:DUF4139 domain-containing protein n=1 Tax=Luteolibacter flavescens TaxID=1859460 RepID=A0ABT3FJV1_9BACT|nr:DUF4139 domain-containing protein [Luteolibacter flavescens]MCW1883854.1 DUF4139 domain-containing protein [Luteolibacter flavescens]
MMKLVLATGFLFAVSFHASGEIPAVPQVESVGLFKNGVAVVRASFEAKEAGSYVWDELPRSIHGGFWIESDGVVSVRATTRMVDEAVAVPTGILQRDLAGQSVTLRLKKGSEGGEAPVVSGKVWALPEQPVTKSWDSGFFDASSSWRGISPPRTETPASTGNFLVLESASGRQFIELYSIASISVDGPAVVAKRESEKPVMVFDVSQPPRDGGRVRITYLARGLAWAPSYRMDMGEGGKLSIRRSTVVRNELIGLRDTEVQLISGFPNIEFAHVDSALWGGATLTAFFQQLGQDTSRVSGARGAATQQMVMYNSVSAAPANALPDFQEGGAGDDLNYESIGKRSLAPGDSLSMELPAAETTCERVVEWVVKDPRDAYGRYLSSGMQRDENEAWDALKFVNPFDFPLTTAPVVITEGGRFRSQGLSQWVNPGQSTCLRMTKALSLQTRSSEVEEEGQRELVWVGGNNYRRTTVRGTLELHNFRGKEVTLDIRAEFSGEMIEAQDKPVARLRTEGVTSVNPRRELLWTLKLAPGEQKTVTYRYSVLVSH